MLDSSESEGSFEVFREVSVSTHPLSNAHQSEEDQEDPEESQPTSEAMTDISLEDQLEIRSELSEVETAKEEVEEELEDTDFPKLSPLEVLPPYSK